MAPPSPVLLLPENVLLVTVSVPFSSLTMAPPSPVLLLLENVLSVTVSVPLLAIAPPLVALLPEKVLPVTVSVPPLTIAPPPAPAMPSLMVRPTRSRVTPEITKNNRVAPPPLIVMGPALSILVFFAGLFAFVIVMVTGLAPQSNITLPPPTSALSNPASVQSLGVPLPTVPHARASCGDHAASATTARPLARFATSARPIRLVSSDDRGQFGGGRRRE
jgi:hypothetical protein